MEAAKDQRLMEQPRNARSIRRAAAGQDAAVEVALGQDQHGLDHQKDQHGRQKKRQISPCNCPVLLRVSSSI